MKKGRFYSWCFVIPIIFFAFVACNANNPQNRDASSTNDSSFSGIYKYGTTAEEGRFGVLYVYPVSDTTMIIYLELSRGKPSYNSGALYSAIHINNKGIAYLKVDESHLDCSVKFDFRKESVEITTDSTHRKCPFGYGVYADGHYKKVSSEKPHSFINRHADTVYFKTLIERYEKGEPIPYSD